MLANDQQRECVAGTYNVNVGPASAAAAWTSLRARATLRAQQLLRVIAQAVFISSKRAVCGAMSISVGRITVFARSYRRQLCEALA